MNEVTATITGTQRKLVTVQGKKRKYRKYTYLSFEATFDTVRDVIDDAETREKQGLTSTAEYHHYLIKREATHNQGIAPLIIELPGLSFAPFGMSSIVLNIPDHWTCPCGTSPVR